MEQRTGYIAIVGRPNVGKSTLLNHMLGMKLSITSRKPQTTRHKLLGILTQHNTQLLFLDTPGMHEVNKEQALNRYMNQQAVGVLSDADLCVFVIDGKGWRTQDEVVLRHVAQSSSPAICALNKVDRIAEKTRLLPVMKEVSEKHDFEAIIPISALQSDGLDILVAEIAKRMPVGPHLFAEDEITDRTTRFLVAEMIREQVVRQLGDELPYHTTAVVENYENEQDLTIIDAVIYVEKDSQKGIVIGKAGKRLKSIGQSARQSIERLVQRRVRLNLLVKVHSGWTNERITLANLGYR